MRETGWSLPAVGVDPNRIRKHLREVDPSRAIYGPMLLSPVMANDNSANNGEVLVIFWFVDNHNYCRSFNYETIYLRTRVC